jgi:uncharacterized protein YpmB
MKKTLILLSISFLVVVTLGYQFYLYVENDYETELSHAKEIALSKTILTRISESNHFSGEHHYFVFKGKDVLDQEAWVWISEDDEAHTEYAENGITREKAVEASLREDANADILRVVPGKLGNNWVWEVFYKHSEEDRFIYMYFDFKTGELLRTYKLNKSISS